MRRSFLRKLLYWLILPGLIFCIVRLFLGYGTDSDTYRMLRTWQTMLLDGHYQASRAQGSLVGEFAIGALASVGGSVGSNAMVFVVALVGLGGLVRWLEDLGVAGGLGVVAVAMTNGLFVIEASTSMDYLLALSPFVLGILAMEREWDALAVVLFGIAGGARLQYFPLSVLVASYLTYRRCGEEGRGVWRPWAAIVGPIVLVTGLFYVPVWIQHHVTLRWIEASRPTQQGLFGLLARLIYKGTYAVGLVAYVSAGVGIVLEWDRWSALELDDVLESKPVVVGLIVIAYHIVLFGYAPIDPAYLLAGIIFGGVVLSALNMRTTIAMLAAGQLVSAVVTVDVLEIQHKQTGLCKPTNATGASPTLTVERGPVLREFDKLEQQRKCYREMLEVPYSHHMEPLPPDEHGREERQ